MMSTERPNGGEEARPLACGRRVVKVDPAADPRWDAFLVARPAAVVFQHSAWLRALEREYGQRVLALACESGDGRFCGVLPLMWTRGLPLLARAVGGRRLASLPRTPVAGPLADDLETAAALVRAALGLTDENDGSSLQLKTLGPDLDGLVPGFRGHPWRLTYRIDLPERQDDLRFGNSRNHGRIRWAVRKAEKEGLRVRAAETAEEVRAWYPLHVEALQRHAVPPRPLRLFLAMWEEMVPRGLMRLLLAEGPRGDLAAGSVILTLGATAFYAFNGVRHQALAARPNDLIQWRAVHDAMAAGCRHYDLGEVVEHQASLADFKRKWGAREERLYRYYHPYPTEPPDPGGGRRGIGRRAAEAVWKRLPASSTRILGDAVYRFL